MDIKTFADQLITAKLAKFKTTLEPDVRIEMLNDVITRIQDVAGDNPTQAQLDAFKAQYEAGR